jgi:hypothetical protein
MKDCHVLFFWGSLEHSGPCAAAPSAQCLILDCTRATIGLYLSLGLLYACSIMGQELVLGNWSLSSAVKGNYQYLDLRPAAVKANVAYRPILLDFIYITRLQ